MNLATRQPGNIEHIAAVKQLFMDKEEERLHTL